MTHRIRSERGFTLAEIIVSLTILSVVLMGFAEVTRRFTRTNTDVTVRTLASDLATARLETIKGHRTYLTLVSTFNSKVDTFSTTSPYRGFTQNTYAKRDSTSGWDYTTITVQVSGRSLSPVLRRTTIIGR